MYKALIRYNGQKLICLKCIHYSHYLQVFHNSGILLQYCAALMTQWSTEYLKSPFTVKISTISDSCTFFP